MSNAPALAKPAPAVERPALAKPAPTQPPIVIADLLKSPATVKRFQQLVPRHLSPERMLRVMAHAIYKTPHLDECAPMSLLGAMQACASLGLEPNTQLGHAFLIPFKKSRKIDGVWVETYEIQVIIGYKGYIDLARRSGNLVSIHADVVYEGDEFEYWYGSGARLRHRPRGRRDQAMEAYAHAALKDGEAFEVLHYPQVLAIRNESQGYKAALAAKAEAERGKTYRMRDYEGSPWVKHEHEMAAKTMVRRLAKWLPMSLDFATAAQLDQMGEAGAVDYAAFTEVEPGPDGFDPEAALLTHETEKPTSAGPLGVGSGGGEPVPPAGSAADPSKPALFGAEG